jgi:hypothetical protein
MNKSGAAAIVRPGVGIGVHARCFDCDNDLAIQMARPGCFVVFVVAFAEVETGAYPQTMIS